MSQTYEQTYRAEMNTDHPCLVDALDSVTTSPNEQYQAVTDLTRRLYFEPSHCYGISKPAFAEIVPDMADHGVRQVALAKAVLSEDLQDRLPNWFDPEVFRRGVLVADVGLAYVPPEEVELVHNYGPRFSRDYGRHPEFGYIMAQHVAEPDDIASQLVAAFIARHHAVQARNWGGLEWSEIRHDAISTAQVDLMVVLQKPFDYFDDCIDRVDGASDFETQVSTPLDKFAHAFGEVLSRHLYVTAAMMDTRFDVQIPNLITREIRKVVLGNTAIGTVYRQLHEESIDTLQADA